MANKDVEYLVSTANPGGTMSRQGVRKAIERLHPTFRSKLAKSIREARAAGHKVGVFSAYRAPSWNVGKFKNKKKSMHAYGVAVDLRGLGGAGSKSAKAFYEIATKNGLYNPYVTSYENGKIKYSNPQEFNHFQLIPTKAAPKAWQDALGKGKPPPTQADLEKIWSLTGVDFNDIGEPGPDPSDPFGVAAFQEARGAEDIYPAPSPVREEDIYPAPIKTRGPIASAMTGGQGNPMNPSGLARPGFMNAYNAQNRKQLVHDNIWNNINRPPVGRVSDEYVQPPDALSPFGPSARGVEGSLIAAYDPDGAHRRAGWAGTTVSPSPSQFEQAGDVIRDSLKFYDYDRKPTLTEADVAANARQNLRGNLLAGTRRPLDFDPANLSPDMGSYQFDVPEDEPSYPVVSSGTRIDPQEARIIRAQTLTKELLANTLPASNWRTIKEDTGPLASLIAGAGNVARKVGDTVGQATAFAKGLVPDWNWVGPDTTASDGMLLSPGKGRTIDEIMAPRTPDRIVRPTPRQTDVYDVPTRVLTAGTRPAPVPQKPPPAPGPIRRALEPLKSVNVGPPPGSRVGVPAPQPRTLPMQAAKISPAAGARAAAGDLMYDPGMYQVQAPRVPIPRMSPIAPAPAPAPALAPVPAEIPAQAPGPIQKLLKIAAPMAAGMIGGPIASLAVRGLSKMFPGILRDAMNYDPVASYNRAIASGVSPSDMVGGSYGGSSYGRKQSDGSVTGTTRSGSGWRSEGGGQRVSVNGRTYTQNKNGRGYSLNL